MKSTDCNGNCNAERPPLCHWATGKAGQAMMRSQDISSGGLFPIKTLYVLKKYRQSSTSVLLCFIFRERRRDLNALTSEIAINLHEHSAGTEAGAHCAKCRRRILCLNCGRDSLRFSWQCHCWQEMFCRQQRRKFSLRQRRQRMSRKCSRRQRLPRKLSRSRRRYPRSFRRKSQQRNQQKACRKSLLKNRKSQPMARRKLRQRRTRRRPSRKCLIRLKCSITPRRCRSGPQTGWRWYIREVPTYAANLW